MKKLPLLWALALLLLAGCSGPDGDAVQTPAPSAGRRVIEVDSETLEQMNAPTPAPADLPAPSPTPAFVPSPSREQVLAAREQALAGMSLEQIEHLYDVIQGANSWWEGKYLYDNIFDSLADPEDLAWNYFDQTGEINVGTSYTGDMSREDISAIMEREDLTWQGFCDKYGTEDTISYLVVQNDCDADGFIAILEDIIAGVQDETFKNDLRSLADAADDARNTHDMGRANDLFKTLHDMDYYLLRYAPDDFRDDVQDKGLVTKYYGMLSFYR